MFDVFLLFAAALRPVFVNCLSSRTNKRHLFYIQNIPILPILINILTWDRLEIISVSDVVSAARVGGAREQLSGKLLPRRR